MGRIRFTCLSFGPAESVVSVQPTGSEASLRTVLTMFRNVLDFKS